MLKTNYAPVENNKKICSYWHQSRITSFAITHFTTTAKIHARSLANSGRVKIPCAIVCYLTRDRVIYICYLPAGRSVWWKTVTEGLKMLPEAAGRGQLFQARGHSFSPYGPTLSRQITWLFFLCTKYWFHWVQMGLFTQLLSLNRPCAPSTYDL